MSEHQPKYKLANFTLAMKIYVIVLLIITSVISQALSESDIHIGYEVTLAIPSIYTKGFVGRAFVMETEQNSSPPKFRGAISVEAIDDDGKDYYSCSLDIFLGDVRVWSSGHLSRFYVSDVCVLQFTQDGDLRLKGPNGRVGWRSGTSGQGVKRLHLLRTGNLVLVDALNLIKWQSFNFPTDIMLWGQRLSSQTRLTSFPDVNSTLFYSFEIQYNKIALCLNLGKWKYSYWEYQPSSKLNITYVQLTSNGLELYNLDHRFDQIRPSGVDPVRFLALDNSTGNLGLYRYANDEKKFEPFYQALNVTCDLPLACESYGVCTSSGSCSCIRLADKEEDKCSMKNYEGLCGRDRAEMLDLLGVVSVLKSVRYKHNVGKEECSNLCLDDCACVALQHVEDDENRSLGECYLYRMVRGIKQVESGMSKVSYMVKVPIGTINHGQGRRSGLKKWVIVVIGVVDGLVIVVVLVGLAYYLIKRRRKNLVARGQAN